MRFESLTKIFIEMPSVIKRFKSRIEIELGFYFILKSRENIFRHIISLLVLASCLILDDQKRGDMGSIVTNVASWG